MPYDQPKGAPDRRSWHPMPDTGRERREPERPKALLRVSLFGAFGAWNQMGDDVLPRGRKAHAILAYLAASGEPMVSRQRLTSLLWSRRWEEQARASLRQSLMELRRAIGSIDATLLRIEKDRISLDHSRVWLDGLVSLFGSVPSTDPDRFLESLRGLDEGFDHWIDAERGRMQLALHMVRETDPPLPSRLGIAALLPCEGMPPREQDLRAGRTLMAAKA
jgi:hypothetical protein